MQISHYVWCNDLDQRPQIGQCRRVRHHGDTARIEVPPQDFEAILKHKEQVCQNFHTLGFAYVSLDLDDFKSGSLNEVLKLT